MNPNRNLIDSKRKFAIAVSGGGQEIFGELTRYGDMSNTLLDGCIPYSVPAFQAYIGGNADKFVSPASARAAAMSAYWRAKQFAPLDKVFGFASTASLVKVCGEREGREHRVCMALQSEDRTTSIDFEFGPGRTRQEEEKLTADCIRVALEWGCHTFADMRPLLRPEDKFLVTSKIATAEMRGLLHHSIDKVKAAPSRAVFSSSCNPLHPGHLKIIEHASRLLGVPVDIELCINNADKPPLDYITIDERTKATEALIRDNPHVGFIIHTNVPFFFEKEGLFPGATFVMGADTFDRIMDSAYYDDGPQTILDGFDDLESLGNSFLVYPRKGYTSPHFDTDCKGLRWIKPEDGYEETDISSTQIRQGLSNDIP